MSTDHFRRIEELERELADLKAQVQARAHQEEARSRRDLIKLAAGATAGGVAMVALGPSGRVAAVDPNDIELGSENLTAERTEASCTSNDGGAAFLFQSGNTFNGDNASFPCALGGWSTSSTRPTGIYGYSESSGGNGIVGWGAHTTGTGVRAIGGRANMRLDPAGGQPPTRGDAHNIGELIADGPGQLWYCVQSGTPGTWRKLAALSTSGAFHAIDPVRAFDSRQAAYAPLNGIFARNTSRVIPVRDGHDAAGNVNAANAVPSGATAVTFNVTITDTTGPNFLSVTPGDAASFTTSTINWSGAGQALANGGVVRLAGNREIKVFCGDQTGSTNVLVDVTGYYL